MRKYLFEGVLCMIFKLFQGLQDQLTKSNVDRTLFQPNLDLGTKILLKLKEANFKELVLSKIKQVQNKNMFIKDNASLTNSLQSTNTKVMPDPNTTSYR